MRQKFILTSYNNIEVGPAGWVDGSVPQIVEAPRFHLCYCPAIRCDIKGASGIQGV